MQNVFRIKSFENFHKDFEIIDMRMGKRKHILAFTSNYIPHFTHFSFEKMISGMYMGEIARLAILQCVENGYLLDGEVSEELTTQYRFYTKYISEIEK